MAELQIDLTSRASFNKRSNEGAYASTAGAEEGHIVGEKSQKSEKSVSKLGPSFIGHPAAQEGSGSIMVWDPILQ